MSAQPVETFHEDAYAEGLIGDDFSSTVRADESMTYSLIGGQTPDPRPRKLLWIQETIMPELSAVVR